MMLRQTGKLNLLIGLMNIDVDQIELLFFILPIFRILMQRVTYKTELLLASW